MRHCNPPMPATAATTLSSLALLLVVTTGCLSQNPPLAPRYFLPTLSSEAATTPTSSPAPMLRLGRVVAAPHLRENLVWRVSEVEIGLDQVNRWGADPAALVEQCLRQELFERAHFREARNAAEIDLRLIAFEGRYEHQDAWVAWVVTLRSDGQPALTTRIESSQQVALSGGSSPSREEVTRLVIALGQALNSNAKQTREWLDEHNAAN